MSHEIALLTVIRDLLLLMAEPALAKRDEKLRSALRTVVGKSNKSAVSVVLMDGSRSQSVIAKEAAMDPGQLNRLVKAMEKQALLVPDAKHPKLLVKIPPNYFDREEKSDE